MPVILQRPIQLIEQDEFSDIALGHVMATVFEVHHDLGAPFRRDCLSNRNHGEIGTSAA